MTLHPIKLPKSSINLFRIVLLQKRLFKALADPALNPNDIDSTWVQGVWHRMDAEWVRKFCLGGQQSVLLPLKAIAAANLTARRALYDEFCKQNKVVEVLNTGGNFKNLSGLPGFTTQLANEVKKFFKRCYKLLSKDANRQWNGYEFNGNRCITNRSYKNDFCSDYPTKVVCPYCDGEIGTPELDHYLFKDGFPLLACSPWNLVPVCSSCNNVITAKGDRPAITIGSPNSADDWLHPFFRPASDQVQIKLNGTPQKSIPILDSPDATEQKRLTNHTKLIQSLSNRWTRKVGAYFDVLVTQVNERVHKNPGKSHYDFVQIRLEDHIIARGKTASSLIHAAVCQAVLNKRPGYVEEFANPNTPTLK
jgi:hypothetical protein